MPRAPRIHQPVLVTSTVLPPADTAPPAPGAPSDNKPKKKRTTDGCHTCRLRRKKCIHDETGDLHSPCQTCSRLKLNCLGYGAKRLAWMKDKERVKEYLSDITEHLKAQGLVRGINKKPDATTPVQTGSSHIATRKRRPVSKSSADPTTTIDHFALSSRSIRRAARHRSEEIDELAEDDSLNSPTLVVSPTTSQEYQDLTDDLNVNPPLPQSSFSPSSPSRSHRQYPVARRPSTFPSVYSTLGPDVHTLDPILLTTGTADASDPYSSVESEVDDPMYSFQYTSTISNDSSYPPSLGSYELVPQLPILTNYGNTMNPNHMDMNVSTIYLRAGPAMVWNTLEGSIVLQERASSPRLFQYEPSVRSMIPPAPHQEDLLFNYLHRVAGFQYIFDQSSRDVMHRVLSNSSTGLVANAIKALSALHDHRIRKYYGSAGSGNLRSEDSYQSLFNTASEQLVKRTQSGAQLTELDGIAALHLVSWHLFEGGGGNWPQALDLAGDWFEREAASWNLNMGPASMPGLGKGPLAKFMEMSPQKKFAAKTVMWMDIFSGISLLKSPRFTPFYDAYLAYEPSSATSIFSSTNGCCDLVMLTLAAIVNLEVYQVGFVQNLNYWQYPIRLLLHQATILRDRLINADCGPPVDDKKIQEIVAAATPDSSSTARETNSDQTSHVTSNIFRHAALIYLGSFINVYDPSFYDLNTGVEDTMQALKALRPSNLDRSLVFPIFIAGCMATRHEQRMFFCDRLQRLSSPVGNTNTALTLMCAIWNKWENGIIIGWRDVMKEKGLDLLLV